ncbi:hypothetical protein PDIG_42460 [Penicillium digitatum PHI26]|uniref:Uncharacterized protein n=2 Tax=Penicillium digitatum TaxID=36651 RepID=K9FSK2_PEND2|nr:hypothetical protein PDIP_41040 [Penicillium digitatum Pd1]EKV12645.1 hypothetical protein PDIG_42460 [Penicillium digitatum PHI26]EKV15045.1 hypothetical protein PDIP_41040 [Penicillium digitatum Pd1]
MYSEIRDLLYRDRTLYTCHSAEIVGFATPRKRKSWCPKGSH